MIYQWRPDRSSFTPVHIQISNYFRSLIQAGILRPDTKIPSQRQLMGLFEVSRTTIATALGQLIYEGLLVSHPKSGINVANIKTVPYSPEWPYYFHRALFRPGVEDYKHWSNRGGVFEFGLSSDFDATKHFEDAFVDVAQKMRTFNPEQLTKYGLRPLRESIAQHLVKSANIHVSEENILIVPSIMLAIYSFYSALMKSGSFFLYEKANLITTITNIHSIGMNMIGIPMDRWGMSESILAEQLVTHKYPVLHLDPTDQAPTGIVMSRKRMAGIMQLVRKYRIPVVEIAHLRDVWRDKPYPPALKSLDGGENVIYMGSFVRSFPFDPRIAWIVADRHIIEHLSDVVLQMDFRPSLSQQLVADTLFRRHGYEPLMEDIRHFVRERSTLALQLCDHYLKDVATWVPKNCFHHFWLELSGTNTRTMFEKKHYDTFAPGYFFDRSDINHVLLCPASLTEPVLEKSIRQIASLAKLN